MKITDIHIDDTLDKDGEIEINIETIPTREDIYFWINKDQAIAIIKHFKKVFKI